MFKLNRTEKNKTENNRPFLCIVLLSTFSTKELGGLYEIINCKYFNTDKYVIRLLNCLIKSILNKRLFNNEVQIQVYKKVFEDDSSFTKVLSKKQKSLLSAKMNLLLRLAEKFLTIEALKNNNYTELLFPQLIKRQQVMLLNRHKKRLKKDLENEVNKSIKHHYSNFKIASLVVDHILSINKLPELTDFANQEYHLDIYYLLNKLVLHLRLLSLNQVQNKFEYDYTALHSIKKLLELPQYAMHPLIIIYKANLNVLIENSSETYTNLLLILHEQESKISIDILRVFYTIAANYCIYQIRSGNKSYNKNIYELYKIMHHKNLLIDNEIVDIQILKNFITSGCRYNEFKLVKSLIPHYENFLPKSIKDSVCNILWGIIAFHLKKYDAAHHYLVKVKPVNLNYDINARVLILRCLYEREVNYNEYTMTAFRSAEKFFLHNKQLSKTHKKGYINFIKILIALFRYRHQVGSKKLENIEEQLDKQNINNHFLWLKEKIEELKSKSN